MYFLTNNVGVESLQTYITLKYFCETIQPIIVLIMLFICMCILKNTEEEIKKLNKKMNNLENINKNDYIEL